MSATDNKNLFDSSNRHLDTLVGPEGSVYITTPQTRFKLPVYFGYIGLNILHDDRPDITRSHLAMLEVTRGAGWLAAKIWAVCDKQTMNYVQAGVVHRPEDNHERYKEVVEAGMFDGYVMRATADGVVAVDGLRREGASFAAKELPVFDEDCADSATVFASAVDLVLKGRADNFSRVQVTAGQKPAE